MTNFLLEENAPKGYRVGVPYWQRFRIELGVDLETGNFNPNGETERLCVLCT